MCAIVVIISLVVGILFLEETHEDKKNRRDVGLDCGRRILSVFRPRREHVPMRKQGYFEETLSLLAEDQDPHDYQSAESSPSIGYSEVVSGEPLQQFSDEDNVDTPKEPAASKAFTPQIMLNIVSLGILA